MLFLTHYFDVIVALNEVVCITLIQIHAVLERLQQKKRIGISPISLQHVYIHITPKCYQCTVRFLATEAAHKANNINKKLVYWGRKWRQPEDAVQEKRNFK